MPNTNHTTILVLGGGFGGLTFCREFQHRDARVVLIDRQNHHLFQPLLYQVATAGLAMPDIAKPLRSILARRNDIQVLMGEVQQVDLETRTVILENREIQYDYLVIALGAVNHYFGHDEWRKHAIGLKSLNDAMAIRSKVLSAFERAEAEEDPEIRHRLTSVAIIGGGPTGVEMAGALAELTKRVFARDFRRVHSRDVSIHLIEASGHLLSDYPVELQTKARKSLEQLGVNVLLSAPVEKIGSGRVNAADQEIRAETIVWTAGVMANPVLKTLRVELDKRGRVKVEGDTSVAKHRNVFCIGDAASHPVRDGVEVPGIAPAAMQAGKHVARLIERDLDARHTKTGLVREPFQYKDRGKMATIGRSLAVAEILGIKTSGIIAWFLWLMVHLVSLIGFRNKLIVLIQWFAAYVRYQNGARILVRPEQESS